MDPALLLRYAVERIHLPSAEGMFLWLCRQPSIQEYYVYLFWLVKVKFFERSSDCDNESYLLRGLSIGHVHIMELLGSYGRGAQYEKDFAYQYLPYVLANAVYYGFFYLCPGSRNIYTRAFKKTILLQVVKIMHGVQLCNATGKVLWSRLFPEDTYEGDDASDEASEAFPVPVALNNELKYRVVSAGQGSANPSSNEGVHERTRTAFVAQTVPPLRSMTASASDVAAAARVASSATEHCSSLLDSEPHKKVKESSRKPKPSLNDTTRQSFEAQHASSSLHFSQLASYDSLSAPRSRCPALSRSISDSITSLTLSSALHPDDLATLYGPYMPHTIDGVVPCPISSPIPSPSRSPLCSPLGEISSPAATSFSLTNQAEVSQKCSSRYDYPHDGSCEKGDGTPLSRTQLRAQTLSYGHKLRALCRRQATETINTKSVSPLIQEYFASSVMSPLKVDLRGQLMQRTVPVSWCATGGVDTHRTGAVYDDFHQTITDRTKESESEFLSASHLGRMSRIDKLRRANDSCHGLLHSDPASRSVFSRDVVEQQQSRRISSSSSSRKGRATASKGDLAHVTPKGTSDSDLLSAKDALQSALFDPFELDSFIAAI
jgi:Protein of unknown function